MLHSQSMYAVVAEDRGSETFAWANAANAEGPEDGNDAVCPFVVGAGLLANRLGLQWNDFTIPDGATILGIEVQVLASVVDVLSAGVSVKDRSITLAEGAYDESGPAGHADTVNPWDYAATWRSYGGVSDLWGLTVAPSDLNNLFFVLQVQGYSPPPFTAAGEADAQVDAAKMIVYYTYHAAATIMQPTQCYVDARVHLPVSATMTQPTQCYADTKLIVPIAATITQPTQCYVNARTHLPASVTIEQPTQCYADANSILSASATMTQPTQCYASAHTRTHASATMAQPTQCYVDAKAIQHASIVMSQPTQCYADAHVSQHAHASATMAQPTQCYASARAHKPARATIAQPTQCYAVAKYRIVDGEWNANERGTEWVSELRGAEFVAAARDTEWNAEGSGMSLATATEVLTKTHAESRLYAANFANLLVSPETIDEILSIAPHAGQDGITMIDHAIDTGAKRVLFRVPDGVQGDDYQIEVIVQTSADNILQLNCKLTIE